MNKKSNIDILKDTFIKYCFNIPYIRYTMMPVIASTIVACYLEVKASVVFKGVVDDIQNSNNPYSNLAKFAIFTVLSISLKQVNEIVFSGPIQYLYKVVGVEAFYHYLSLSYSQFNEYGNGEIQMIIERRSRAFGDILELTTLSAFPTLLTLFLSFYTIYTTLNSSALYIMLCTAVIYVYITFVLSVWRSKIRKNFNQALDASSNKLQDFLANHEIIKSHGTETYTKEYFDNTQKSVEFFAILSHRVLYILFYLQKLIFAIQAILIVGLEAYGYFTEYFSPQKLAFYLTISKTLTSSLNEMGTLYNRYVQGFINAKSGCFEYKKKDELKLIREFKFSKCLEFKNVSFHYKDKQILNDVNFRINKNEKVAIIGKNGTGKSTIIKLLIKFYDYTGEIILDDINIQEISDTIYRQNIAYATQNTYLFDNDIQYNIKYGCKQITDKEIIEMAKCLNIHDSIAELKDLYNCRVGARGKLLASGDRQKLILMRTLLKKSPLILMDEPTSSLDKETEKETVGYILENCKNATIVMIVHNLDLIKYFDKVLFVKDESVVTVENVKEKLLMQPNYFTKMFVEN